MSYVIQNPYKTNFLIFIMPLSILTWILIITTINGFLAFAGGIIYLILRKNLNRILIFFVAFTTGALLGGAFFHFLPEAFAKLNLYLIIILTIAGIVLFYLVEKILHWHHCHDGKCKKHPFTFLILYGDAIHNFIDGLIIAGSFLISVPFGFLTSILILLHELPQEIGDFGVLIYGGHSVSKALTYNFLAQLTSILGGILGYFFITEQQSIYLLPVAAGGFLYIAIADLIPEVFKQKKPVTIVINLMAIIFGLLILISAKLFGG